MIFRAASSDDITILLELEQEVVEAERPFNNAIKSTGAVYYDLEALIESDKSMVLVAENDGVIVATGYVDIRPSKASLCHSHHGYLGFMYVSPEHRGKGLNREIMQKLIEWARQKQIYDFYLDVYAQNDSAIKAYEKAGFEPSLMEMKLHIE